jgi:hypothetical protein
MREFSPVSVYQFGSESHGLDFVVAAKARERFSMVS